MSPPLPLARLDSLLVANRGEIALRVARSARARGLRVAMVGTPADLQALHREAGDSCLAIPDYLDIDALVEAARGLPGRVGVHPGYGFLAENPRFAAAVEAHGLVFVGPPAAAIEAMGDKARARVQAAALGVPVVPGYDGEAQDDESLRAAALRVGFPLLVKASAGGGGKGMRVVEDPAQLPSALDEARRLARAAFGDDRLLLERLVRPARHVEVQVLADAHGGLRHLFTRDCSLQRRHQKLIEEAPAPGLSAALQEALHQDALRIAAHIGYRGAGTVEFLVGPAGEHFFLEMNTRIQVEHPVTEAITGLDLVDLQLAIAEGEPIPFAQEELRARGHAIEARIIAEEAWRGFLPSGGRIRALQPPPELRWDGGVREGDEPALRYDALLGKLVAHGADREQARRRLAMGLERLVLLGPGTTRTAARQLLDDPLFRAGQAHTAQVEAMAFAPPGADELALYAALGLFALADRATRPLPEVPAGWRNLPWRPAELLLAEGERVHRLRYQELGPGLYAVGPAPEAEAIPSLSPPPRRLRVVLQGPLLLVELDGRLERLRWAREGEELWLHRPDADLHLRRLPALPEPRPAAEAAGSLRSPLPGTVVRVEVQPGEAVTAGRVLLRIEAMKMEQAIRAPAAGVVRALRVAVGQTVAADQVLVELEESVDAS